MKILKHLFIVIGIGFSIGSIFVCLLIALTIFNLGSITFIEPNLIILTIELIGLIIALIANIYCFTKGVQ